MFKRNINFNLYKTFYDVAKSGSISKAAKMTFTSQPAISKSIKKLEDELQTKLFYRNLNGTTLTQAGQELLFYVEEAFNSLVIAERNIIENESLEKGKLSIGIPSHIASFYVFDNVASFHKMYPNIEIKIVSDSTPILLSLLESHELDFIIIPTPVELDNRYIVQPLKQLQNSFVKSKNSKLFNGISKLKDLENFNLILPIKGTSNRTALDETFESNGIEINNVLNIHYTDMIIAAIKAELGIGYLLLDTIKAEIERGELEVINIKEPLPKTTIKLVYIEKYLTVAPYKFIKMFVKPDIADVRT